MKTGLTEQVRYDKLQLELDIANFKTEKKVKMMSEELIVRCCAPTLASLKTANLFTCRCESRQEMYDHIRHFNRRLRSKGIRMLPMRYENGTGLVYVYRPSKLQKDLSNEKAAGLLAERGYTCCDPNHCIRRLQQEIAQGGDFPHEIGLFLGYPPADVEGFIHRKKEAKCSGCWKVYDDEESARRTFARYRKCTDVYMRHLADGSALERLTVSA